MNSALWISVRLGLAALAVAWPAIAAEHAQIEPWYAAYDVKPGDALYLAPSDRARIW